MNKEQKIQQGRQNREWGEYCEQIAADYFLKEGYVIRERNWKHNKLEIDLILEKDRTIIFVEVKARLGNNQDPVDAVDLKKRKRTINAADNYLRRLTLLYQYRFDIFAVTGNKENYRWIHLADAFLPDVNGKVIV